MEMTLPNEAAREESVSSFTGYTLKFIFQTKTQLKKKLSRGAYTRLEFNIDEKKRDKIEARRVSNSDSIKDINMKN